MTSESTPEGVGAGGLLRAFGQQSGPRLLFENLALTVRSRLEIPSSHLPKPEIPRHRHHRR